MSAISNHRPTDRVGALFQTGKLVRYTKRQLIFQGADEPHDAFYIIDGFVKVYSFNARGEEYIHLVYGKGEIFPITALTANLLKRNVYYAAMGPCALYRLELSKVQAAIKNDGEFAYALLQKVAEQFRVYSDRIDNLEFKYARERLVYRLLFLASRFGHRREDSYLLEAPLTQQTIADSINLSRESVSREFERLQSKGIVAYEDRSIIIKDVRGLVKQLPEPVNIEWFGLSYFD